MKKIILASKSPTRKRLLEKTGLNFEVVASDFEERLDGQADFKELAKSLSFGKAKAVANKLKNAIVIGVDTFITFKGKIIGKPRDEKEAYKMLQDFSGKSHPILTGFTIIDSDTGKHVSKVDCAIVYFKKLSPLKIKKYVESGEPFGKAGGYAIQENGKALIEKVEGDENTVAGLPVRALLESLKEFGIDIK